MKYADAKSIVTESYRRYMEIIRAIERDWKVSDTMYVRIYSSCWGGDDVLIAMTPHGEMGRNYEVCQMSARELRQLAALRDLVDAWRSGTRADLPAECPIEIVQLA